MYSLLPSIVAILFLAYGVYVLAAKGFSRVTGSFFLLCLTTFFWQAIWAVLFQIKNDPALALLLAKSGYLLIIFLPTSLYHFLTEISGLHKDRRWVYASYVFAAVLGAFNLFSNWFVDGTYSYFFGSYPKAGLLHPLHVLQTMVVVNRGLYLTYRASKNTSEDHRLRLRLCLASVLIYFFAAVDYLCNYGIEFYPPGIIFVTISLGLITYAVTRWDLMAPLVAAATVAHEVRTPLARIAMQADYLQQQMPTVFAGYRAAVAQGLVLEPLPEPELRKLDKLFSGIAQQVERCNTVIDMLLASIKADKIDVTTFSRYRMSEVIEEALQGFPFTDADRKRVQVDYSQDFVFHGSRALLVFVLFNLIKNALYAIKQGKRGEIYLSMVAKGKFNVLHFRDTGPGISEQAMPKIFDTYFTTKASAGLGIGLPFCRRVVRSFGGDMRCESQLSEYTLFSLSFPALSQDPTKTAAQDA